MDNFIWSQIINYYAPAIRVVPLPKEYGIDRLELDIMAGTEPLNKDGSPLHHKARKSSTAGDGGSWDQKRFRSCYKYFGKIINFQKIY